MAGDELGHRVHVARLRPAALQVAVLEVRGRDLQGVSDPLAGGESGPAVRRLGRRVRPAVHEDRPVQRAHELDVVDARFARQRILLLEDARAAEAAPLVRRRVRPALVLRRSPDRFGRRVRAHAAGIVERNARGSRQTAAARWCRPRCSRGAIRPRCQEGSPTVRAV